MNKTPHNYKPKSAWNILGTQENQQEIQDTSEQYIAFLSTCKTEREAVTYVLDKLTKAGFKNDFQSDKYVNNLRGKAVFAIRKGKLPLSQGLHIISAHLDTPRLDFKQRPLIEQAQVAQAKTHYYGGIRKYQWLARPLALHGVIAKKDGSIQKICIGESEHDPVFTIADLLPHLAQNHVKQTIAEGFEAEKLNIIIGHNDYEDNSQNDEKNSPNDGKNSSNSDKAPSIKDKIIKLLFEQYNITEEDFISAEIQAVPAGAARFVGFDKALIGGYGQDDRICVFSALNAFLHAEKPEHATVIIFSDKEEIGSNGATGASSNFFEYNVQNCMQKWEPNTLFSDVMLNSAAICADAQAALDPDWQDVHEKQNAALLGYGPCFSKFTGSRGKYGASEASAEYVAWWRNILSEASIPWQMAECGKVDHGGGGTEALFLAMYGMNIIDFGPPILSMHSPFELSSCIDLFAVIKAYKIFLNK